MYTVEQYIQDTKSLTNSLVIKINEIPMVLNTAVTIEAENRNEAHMVPNMTDKRSWKYYLNLAGKMHPYDTPVKIRVLETDTEEVLTAELLERYPTTAAELRENTGLYEQLMLDYPEHIRYIHGCMYPVDIDKAIAAKEGTILAYNKRYVEENEYYLIRDLEIFIENILSRWHVKPYTVVDELYLPALLAFLHSAVLMKIHNLRLSKVHTFQVHSFHLEHYFRSHMDLWDDIKVLNKPSIFWLYKNLDVMMHNVGKAKTFEKIYNKLFWMNGIGLGEYKASRMDPKYAYNMYDITEASFVRQDVSLVTNQLNEYYLTNLGNVTSVESMIRNELDLLPDVNKNIPANFKRYFIETGVSESERVLRETEKTKILDIDAIKTLKKTGLDLYSLVMDYWVYCLYMDKLYKNSVTYPGNIRLDRKQSHSFTDEEIEIKTSENKVYKVTPKIGLLMLIKLMLYSTNELNKKINKIKYFRIMDHNKDKFQEIIDTKIIKDGLSHALLRAIKDELIPEPAMFPTIKSFQTFLGSNIELAKAIWVFMANAQNFLTTSNVKMAFLLMAKDGYLELSEDGQEHTIDELLAQHGVEYNVDSNTDLVRTMSLLVETFTGVKLDLEDELIANMNKYRTILYKLTSYSLQALGAEGIDKEIVAYYNNPTMLKTEKGFVMTYGLDLRGLEPVYAKIIGHSNDNPKGLYLNRINYRPYLAIDGPLTGDLILYGNELIKQGYPTEGHYDFVTVPHYLWEHHKWFVDWVTVKQMDIFGLEKNITEMKADATPTNMDGLWSNLVKDKGAIKRLEAIKGDMVITEGPWLMRTGHYDFATMPLCWYKPLLDKLISTSGMELIGLEEGFGVEAKSKEDTSKPPSFLYVADQGKMKKGEVPQLEVGEKSVFSKDDIAMSLNKKNTVLKLEAFPKNKKYVSIGLLAFKIYDQHGIEVTDSTSGYVTYISKNVVSKNKALHLFDSVYRNDVLKEQIKDLTIDKATTIGLAMLPFKLELDATNTLGSRSKIQFLGLLDEAGILDIYDCRDVTTIDNVYVQHQPIIRVNNFSILEMLPGKELDTLVLSDMDIEALIEEYKTPKEPGSSIPKEDIEQYKEKLKAMSIIMDPELIEVLGKYDVERYPILKNLKINKKKKK